MQKVLHSSERQEEHFKELPASLVTLLFKANPFLAIIPGFVHRKGDLFYHSSDRDVKISTAVSEVAKLQTPKLISIWMRVENNTTNNA